MDHSPTIPPAGPRARRRIAAACSYCRRRKRKCDGKQPVCSLCEEANESRCLYEPTGSNLHRSTTSETTRDNTAQLLERIRHLEQVIARSVHLDIPGDGLSPNGQLALQHDVDHTASEEAGLSESVAASPGQGPNLNASANTPVQSYAQASISPYSDGSSKPWGGQDSSAMTIPLAHHTTTGDLLHSEAARGLLGDYPKNAFFRVETRRTTPPQIQFNLSEGSENSRDQFPNLATQDAEYFLGAFFAKVHPQHPILEGQEVMAMFAKVRESPSMTREAALILVLLGLGSTVSSEIDTSLPAWVPGSEYFKPALCYIVAEWHNDFTGDLILAQTFFLAALYYSHLARPLHAWRMAHLASTCAQHITIQAGKTQPDQRLVRLCWAIFTLECDIIAEYHLPRSGIEQMAEDLPFPECGNPPLDHMLRWLANLASRQLLNRIHHFLYDQDRGKDMLTAPRGPNNSAPTPSDSRYTDELSHQLQAWSDLIPQSVKPDFDASDAPEGDAIIILRFHAAGDIIFRPKLLYVLGQSGPNPCDAESIDGAKRCLYHCRAYLAAFKSRTQAPHASLEITLHSALAAILLLTSAALSPWLGKTREVDDIARLQDETISIFRKWAFPGSSIEAMLNVALAIRMKYHLLK